MPRHRLTLAYEGTDFHGWQRQLLPQHLAQQHGHTTTPPPGQQHPQRHELRTVQGELERALTELLRTPTTALGASRTDAGVHAQHQTAAFSTLPQRTGPPDERLADAINSRLPRDVLVTSCTTANDHFDPIAHCIGKGYRYAIHTGRARPLFDRRTVTHVVPELDYNAMNHAAAHLVGEHDFAAFAAANHGRDSTVRTVWNCRVTRTDEHRLHIDIAGNGFLYNMVRIIAGTLVDVGRRKRQPDDTRHALLSNDRRAAGPTLPPEGLCLMWQAYPGDQIDQLAHRHGLNQTTTEAIRHADQQPAEPDP